jgi:molybdopterin/thiamine biosynthesis adenylyltransferase
MAMDINPELDIKQFPDGIHDSNLAEFFDGVDLYVDGLDFFAFPARQATFARCARTGIPPSRPRRWAWARPCSISCRAA